MIVGILLTALLASPRIHILAGIVSPLSETESVSWLSVIIVLWFAYVFLMLVALYAEVPKEIAKLCRNLGRLCFRLSLWAWFILALWSVLTVLGVYGQLRVVATMIPIVFSVVVYEIGYRRFTRRRP